MGYVLRLALRLFGLVARPHPAPLPTSQRGNLARPTGYELLKHCWGIQVFGQARDCRVAAFPIHCRPALVVLTALDLSKTIFTIVAARAASACN